MVSFSNFSILERTLGVLGSLFHYKSGLSHQRRPKMQNSQNTVAFGHPFGSHFEVLFGFEALFLGSVFVEFWGRFFSQFDIVLYLLAPLALVIVGSHSIRKRVSCKSKGMKFSTCFVCFVDFVSRVVF